MRPQIVIDFYNQIRLALAFSGYQIESRHIANRRRRQVIHHVEKAISQNSQLHAYFSINLSDNKFIDEFLFDEGGAS